MNKILARCILIVAIGVWVCISLAAPWVLDDTNSFLRDFANHEFLNVLGLIVAITLASTANLHLQFNQIEDHVRTRFLNSTRASVKNSSYWLVFVFVMGIIAVTAKPLLPAHAVSSALVNGFVLLILLSSILVLIDITRLVFQIPPMFEVTDETDEEETEP